jgi:hypothetical protein
VVVGCQERETIRDQVITPGLPSPTGDREDAFEKWGLFGFSAFGLGDGGYPDRRVGQ